ncbi:MAG: alginate export family protein, partial [Candidatus Omnitrophota bacterium]|nr:alginate export family protein [Candidatus Omnitrophota bacterium]
MSKRLILILALAFVVGITFAAYAEVQNVKVSGDITVKGVARNNLTLDKDVAATPVDFGKKIRGVISQARVRIDADLTDNVATTVRLLNERVWGEETDGIATPADSTKNNNTEIDLDLAYVTMKEFLYSPLSLTIGRQELRFGNGLIIGDPDTNAIAAGHLGTKYLPNSLDDLSLRKAFDAVRATLDYNPLVVDLIYSKISESAIATFDDVNLYGANASYEVSKNLIAEGYIFQRARDRGVVGAIVAGQAAKKEKLTTVGAKANYTGEKLKGLSLGLEGAYQFGDHIASTLLYPDEGADTKVTRKVGAFALQATGSYKVPRLTRYAPVLGGSYTFLSGDKADSTNDHYRGWDSMFEDQNGGTIFNKIFALTNMQIV